MSTPLTTLVQFWPKAWRFPRLWTALCNNKDTLDLRLAAEDIIASYAKPLAPEAEKEGEKKMAQEIWQMLLEQGEFNAAERLLDQDDFPLSKDEKIKRKLYDELQKERLQKLEDLNLRNWLASMKTSAPDPTPAMSGSTLPDWPYRGEPVEKICRWFLKDAEANAPRGFNERWGPPRSDRPAYDLLQVLLSLISSSPDAVDPVLAAQFGNALTIFLTGGSALLEPAQLHDGFHWTKICNLDSPWLPALIERHGRNWPLAIPNSSHATDLDAEAVKDLVCVFDPWKVLSKKITGSLVITPTLLFRLMRYPDTRLKAFLHEIGEQIPLSRALPDKLPHPDDLSARYDGDSLAMACLSRYEDLKTPKLDRFQLHSFLSHFFWYLGITANSPQEDFQRIVYYGGKHPEQLRNLLRHIFHRLDYSNGTRRSRLNSRVIKDAWFDASFRRKTKDFLDSNLKTRPIHRLILGLLIYDSLTSGNSLAKPSVSTKDLIDGISGRGVEIDNGALEKYLHDLEELGLLESSRDNDFYGLTSDGTGAIICEIIGRREEDLDEFIASALSEITALP